MPSDVGLKETLEYCIARERGNLAAHGTGSKNPWEPTEIRKTETRLDHLKFMRDRVSERLERRSA